MHSFLNLEWFFLSSIAIFFSSFKDVLALGMRILVPRKKITLDFFKNLNFLTMQDMMLAQNPRKPKFMVHGIAAAAGGANDIIKGFWTFFSLFAWNQKLARSRRAGLKIIGSRPWPQSGATATTRRLCEKYI
jgi:hypothetical protein